MDWVTEEVVLQVHQRLVEMLRMSPKDQSHRQLGLKVPAEQVDRSHRTDLLLLVGLLELEEIPSMVVRTLS